MVCTPIFETGQQPYHRLSRRVSGTFPDMGNECVQGFAYRQRHQGLLMRIADEGIDFPVADADLTIDNGRALVNRNAVFQLPAVPGRAVALPAVPLAAQVGIQITA